MHGQIKAILRYLYPTSVYNTTVSHWPFSDQVMLLTNQFSQWSVIYADQLFLLL